MTGGSRILGSGELLCARVNGKLASSFAEFATFKTWLDSPAAKEQNRNEILGRQMLPVQTKLEILADAAKYDASCASSGAPKRNARELGGIGSTSNGICHSYTPDGRCVSLLKILLTNACIFDCSYCINRRSSNVRRARLLVQEGVGLPPQFFPRHYIRGLVFSSRLIPSS